MSHAFRARHPREKPCDLNSSTPTPLYSCIGDHWAAGETLVDVIMQIGEMIQYQSYNPKSPLNATAARWAEQNQHLFPIGTQDLWQPEVDIELLDEDEDAAAEDAEDLGIELH